MYTEKMMGHLKIYLRYIFVITSLIISTLTFAQTDNSIEAQRADCNKSPSSEWSSALNRCVIKQAAKETRNAVLDCSAIKNADAQKKCYMDNAEKSTGLSSDVNSLPQSTTGSSAVMNGVAGAYAAIGLISSLGISKNTSACMSKKIFGLTSLGGFLTDIWLKAKAKKKMDELKGKYQFDVKNSAYNAQKLAFEYLKEEQATVKEIASGEKTRNLLLTLGYGAATAMAIYESIYSVGNPQCYTPKETKTADAAPSTAAQPNSLTENSTIVTANAQGTGTPGPSVGPAPVPETPAPVSQGQVVTTDTSNPTVTSAPTAAPIQATPPEGLPNYRFMGTDPGIYERAGVVTGPSLPPKK